MFLSACDKEVCDSNKSNDKYNLNKYATEANLDNLTKQYIEQNKTVKRKAACDLKKNTPSKKKDQFK